MQHGRLIISGSNRLFREGLRRVLAEADFEIAGEVDSLSDGLAMLNSANTLVDLIIHDQHGSFTQVADDLTDISRQFPQAGIVILSDSADGAWYATATDAKPRAFLPKSISSTALCLALQLILLDEDFFVGPNALQGGYLAAAAATNNERLEIQSPQSPREREVLDCVASGSSNKIIARKLDMAEATVKVHVKTVLRKINVLNRTQAAVWAINQRGFAPHSRP